MLARIKENGVSKDKENGKC